MLEGQSITRPPYFNGQHYGWWKNRMENYIQAEDYELWMLIKNGPLIPKATKADGKVVIKQPEEFDSDDYRMMEKNAKAKKLLYFGLGPDEYTRISECESAKEIWDALQIAHEGTNQVKQSRIELLMRKYELFEMGDREAVMDMYTRFTHITNELKSLGKIFTTEELVRKILRFLPRSWEAKVTAIQEAKDLKVLSLDELIGNLQTYELRRTSQQQEDTKKDRGLALKTVEEASSDSDDEDLAMFTRKFKKFFKKTKAGLKAKQPSKPKGNDQFTGCFKCGKLDHIIKNCPQLKEEQAAEAGSRVFRRKNSNNSGKRFAKAMMAAWGDSSDEEEGSGEEEQGDVALMARSETESDEESGDSLIELKNKVSKLNKPMLKEYLLMLMDECDSLHSENRDLTKENEELKKVVIQLRKENKNIQDEKIELDMNNLVLIEDFERTKEILKLKEECFAKNYDILEKESLKEKEKIESLLVENQKLNEKLKQVEQEQAVKTRWLDSSVALNWLNTHHNRGKQGLGFVKKHTIYPCKRKYLGLPENIVCYHCGKTGHVRYVCPSRDHALKKNFHCVKQIWIRKDELSMLKGMGPKQVWVPKTNK